MQLRPALVEYVLAHELAHFREPHHGPVFWQLLGRAMPDYDDRSANWPSRERAYGLGGTLTNNDGAVDRCPGTAVPPCYGVFKGESKA